MAYSLTYSYNSTSESYTVTGYSNITTSDNVVIPDTYNDGTNGSHPVKSIGIDAFKNCSSLTSIIIPDSVTIIGNSAFSGCNSLTSIMIPDSVTYIGDYAFNGCSKLTGVYITDMASWCKISFSNSDSNPLRHAKNLYLNNELVTELVIPDSVTSIGNNVFYNCSSLTSIYIPNSVTSIGNDAFNFCSSLTSVTIPDSLTSIGNYAFCNCSSLTSVTIGSGVTSIGKFAFYGCSSLTSVTIPDSVTSIGNNVFYNCSKLKQLILFPSTPPTLGSDAIPNNVQSIYVQQSSKAAYQAADKWAAFASKIVSDNLYLSFARFNIKNKEYIDSKTNGLSTIINLENGTGDVLIQTTDTNHSFKVMKDGRAKVQSAPIDNDDVVRKLELDAKIDDLFVTQEMASFLF